MASLIDQYGEEEAKRIWGLWQNDPWWMWALGEAQDSWRIWASEPGWIGTFHRDANTGRITISLNNEKDNSSYAFDLFAWQGRGGYMLQPVTGDARLPEMCHNTACGQAVYGYGADGRPISDEPLQTRRVWWEKTLGGIPNIPTQIATHFWTDVTTGPEGWKIAPWCKVVVLCDALGFVDPGYAVANFYDAHLAVLTVSWISEANLAYIQRWGSRPPRGGLGGRHP